MSIKHGLSFYLLTISDPHIAIYLTITSLEDKIKSLNWSSYIETLQEKYLLQQKQLDKHQQMQGMA